VEADFDFSAFAPKEVVLIKEYLRRKAVRAKGEKFIDYVQGILREATEGAVMRPGNETVELDFAHWQVMLELQARLAGLLRGISEPS
jgi:hypothetical protein